MKLRLEDLLVSPKGFGLESASPLQRAICRVSDGEEIDEYWLDENVRAAFGYTKPPTGTPPEQILILSAIRSGKSLISAAKAVQISQNISVDHPFMSAGDELRIPIVAPRLEEAKVVFSHMVGQILAKPLLRKLMVGDPRDQSFWLKHPTGRVIEVCTTPLAKSGATLVARWLPSVVFDEAPLMASVEDAKRNLTEALGAINGRVLPGGQVMLIGSPWAPFGPVFDMVTANFGKPTTELVIARAPGPVMNPNYWTPKRCESVRKKSARDYQTNVLAEFADMEDGIFSSIEIENATRPGPVVRAPVETHHYVAAMDPAFRGNAWTLIIIECTGIGGAGGVAPLYSVAMARQWIGSKQNPLKADVVMKEIADICREYGIDTVTSDQHNVDVIGEFAERHGLSVNEIVISASNRLEMIEKVNSILADGRLELPPDRQLAADMKSARKRVTQNGVTLVLPRSGDGRHADYVPALGLAFERPPDPPEAGPGPERTDLDRHLERFRARNEQDYWGNVSRRIVGH